MSCDLSLSRNGKEVSISLLFCGYACLAGSGPSEELSRSAPQEAMLTSRVLPASPWQKQPPTHVQGCCPCSVLGLCPVILHLLPLPS